MTKNEWRRLRVGSRVATVLPDLDFSKLPERVFIDRMFLGTVTHFNSNGSQAHVQWDDDGTGRASSGRWYGRLGIEMALPEKPTASKTASQPDTTTVVP